MRLPRPREMLPNCPNRARRRTSSITSPGVWLQVVEGLVDEGKLHTEGRGLGGNKKGGGALQVLDRRKAPASGINIRSIGSGHYTLINMATKAVMETLEAQTAFYQVRPPRPTAT